MSRCRRSSKADNVDHLCYELRLWSEQGNLHRRPVSTVHLGGGTPTFFGETGLTRVVECCRECFHVSSDAEAHGLTRRSHLPNPRYARYLHAARSGWPGLEGGLRRNAFENRMQPLIATVLSGHIPPAQCEALKTPEGESLVERWQARGLVEADPRAGLRLTASGAWFAGNLIAELTGQGPHRVYQA